MNIHRVISPAIMTVYIFLLGATASTLVYAEPIKLKFGHVGAPGSLFAASAEEFAKRANTRLKGKARIIVYGSSQLGKDKQLIQKLKLGTVDFALPSTVMSSVSDKFGMFEMPYLVKDRGHMKRIEKELVWSRLVPSVEKQGLKIIAVWENGFRQITNNTRPVHTPKDLKGLKLRTPKGEWRVKMFKSYGANPSPMSLSEVFVALQTGVMDGQENPLIQIYSQKFQEVQKYLSLTGHVYTPAYVTVGIKKWNKLPADVRKILEQTAKETQSFVYQTAQKFDDDLMKKIKAAGMKVNEVNKDKFVEASKPIYAAFGKKVSGGKELVDRAMALTKTE